MTVNFSGKDLKCPHCGEPTYVNFEFWNDKSTYLKESDNVNETCDACNKEYQVTAHVSIELTE